ncbi:hypothetical protein P8452_63970 [Trifolium repens]|nr:hypothetical protein P8452_63970 [Trifolium repens]
MDPKDTQVGKPPINQRRGKAGLPKPSVVQDVQPGLPTPSVAAKVKPHDAPSPTAVSAQVHPDIATPDIAVLTPNLVQVVSTPDHTDASPAVVDKPVQRTYDPVANVSKRRETWRLGVIIDDIWTVYKGETEDHVELLIRDKQGDTIQATIMGEEISTWKPVLVEGNTYYMRNFRVYDNTSDYKVSPHKFRLTFVNATRVEPAELAGIPPTMFKFKDFSEILSGQYKSDHLIDAIGVIQEIRKVVPANSTRKANVAFTIKDLSGVMVDCTLWDSLSVEFITHYTQHTETGPVVVIIKHARIKEPQGIYPIQLTNVWNGTKLLWDPAIPDIRTFVTSMPKELALSTQHSASSNTTQFYSQSSAGSQFNSDENFMKQARIVNLSDMKKLKVDTYCVTVVTTDQIKVSNQGWFYYGCPDCGLKADGKEPPFICKKGHQTNNPLIKYKLDVEVCDDTDTAKFVFWDSALDELVGLTAAGLLEHQKKLGVSDPQEYPQKLEDLMHRKFAFRIKWQPGWGGQGTVSLCRDSIELIDKIQEHLPAAESQCKDIEAIEENNEDTAGVNSSSPIQHFTSSDIEKFAALDDAMLSTPNSSASADTDNSASNLKTPAKRNASKHTQIDPSNLDSQFSSTRAGKLIKKEKL